MRGLHERSLGDPSAGARRVALTAVRAAAKTVAAPFLAGARATRLFPLARGVVRADDVAAGLRSARLELAAPARTADLLGIGGPCAPTEPTTTVVTVLDGPRDLLTFRSNHVVDRGGCVVLEQAYDEEGVLLGFRDLQVWRVPLEPVRRLSGTVAYLSNTGVHNWGHWLLFVYPLVEVYREHLGSDPDWYYLGTPAQEWHYDSLAELGIPRERVVSEGVSGDRMVAAIADRAIPPPSRFLDFSTRSLRLPRDPTRPANRVYISRALRPRRPLLNEAECLGALERLGFRAYATETLTLSEERELFANAECVVGLHGAGLANLLLCNPPCGVVELFAKGFQSGWFVEAAAERGLTYAAVHGRPTNTRALKPKDYHALIDVEELESVVRAALAATADADEAGEPAGSPA